MQSTGSKSVKKLLILFCLLFKLWKHCAMTFRSLLQLAVKWRLAGCRNNKVHLTRLLPAETSCVCVLAMWLTCQKYWTSKHCPFFLSTCCALLSLISWQEVGSRHVPIREQRYCSEVFSANMKTVSAYCYGSSASIPVLLSSDLKSIFQPAHTSREDMMIRTFFFPHLTGQNHQIVQTSKKRKLSWGIFKTSQHRMQSLICHGLKNVLHE